MVRHNALREQVAMIDEVHCMKDSRAKGFVEGIEEAKEDVAQKMLKKGMEKV